MKEKEQYQQLIETINHHMDLYYNEDAPEISDFDYDALMQQLKETEAAHPDWVTADSPTQKIGGTTKREAGVAVVHNVPMLSIQDVFTKEDVTAWVEKVQHTFPDARFCVEEKIDGLSMSLRYQDGRLVLAETRGDGLVGEDVTANALVISDVKKTIDLPGYAELRGEVYMSHADFARFNEAQEAAGKKMAANPRNLAAGTLRQLDAAVVKKRGLKLLIFNVQDEKETGISLMESHAAGLDALAALGIPVVRHVLCSTPEEVLAAIDAIGEGRGSYGYDIDGAVIKIDQIADREAFPAGSKYSAGHLAYKYPPEEKEVIIETIEVNVGRTGNMTFRAIFKEPVRLCATSVQKATLHNADFIQTMGIAEGCRAICRKQGDIIPAIVRVTQPAEAAYVPPVQCPVCGAGLTKEADTCDLYCTSPSCPAQRKRTLAYFAGKDAMDIKNFGTRYVEALVDLGYLKTIPDIYTLKEHRDALIEAGILGREKNTDRILEAIEGSKNNEPEKLLTGFAIRNVGRISARQMMKHYTSLWALAEASVEELQQLPDVGEITARAVADFFAKEENRQMMAALAALGVNMEGKQQAREEAQPLAGMIIVVTGTLAHFGRKEIAAFLEQQGARVTGSVSKKTSCLVAGENAGSKLTKAEALGIPVWTEEELLQRCGAFHTEQ